MRATLTWLAVVPLVAWTIGRTLGLENGYPLVPLMAWTPFAALAAVVVTVALAFLRARAAVVAAACAVLLVVAVAPRAFGGPSDTGGPRLRILTLNMRYGSADLSEVRALARRADVVSLQEVTPEAARRLGPLLPYRVVRAAPGARGTALYARVPLDARPDPAGTDGNIAVARARVAGTAVELVAAHPPAPLRGTWVAERDRELARFPAAGDDVVRILAGDFNATLDHRPLRRLIGRGYEDAADAVGAGLKPTWPVGGARWRVLPVTIDHVLVDARCGVRSVTVHRVAGSDHRAVLASITLPSEQ